MSTDLDSIIRNLQALRELVGNVEVWHHDCEWGLSEANPGLCKVLPYIEGHNPIQWSPEMVEPMKRAIAEHRIEDYEKVWDEDQVTHTLWNSREEFLESARQDHQERLDFLRRYELAPFAVVF